MVYPVQLKNIDDVKRLNKVATEQNFDIYISCDNIMVDLKSLLGLFTLLGKAGFIVAPDHANPDAFLKALKRMGLLA
jgi:hypothetical protein